MQLIENIKEIIYGQPIEISVIETGLWRSEKNDVFRCKKLQIKIFPEGFQFKKQVQRFSWRQIVRI